MASPLNVTDLDFNGIRENLKTWMRDNPEFADFDFEAAGLSFLLDVLAYNTHYNSVLANYMANEMFLDSAIKRNSVLSHAKALGYKPKGYVAARAKITLTVDSISGGTAPSQFILRRGTAFNTTKDNTYYQFVTSKDYTADKTIDGKYIFNEIEVIEGVFNTFVWKLLDDITAKYTIPNVRVDDSSITMHIYDNVNSVGYDVWYKATNLSGVYKDSKVFFTQETEKNFTEFYFGNGIIGARPIANSVIKIEYVSTNGSAGNGCKLFAPAGTLRHDNGTIVAATYTLSTISAAANGSDAESVDNIKYHASNHFAMQNRAVTVSDYVALIKENYPNVESLKVWGGEDAEEKQYGVVYICIKPEENSYLNKEQEDEIKEFLKTKSVMGRKIEFVDPEYINIVVDSKVQYDFDKREQNLDLKSVIKDEILRFSDIELESFDNNFYYSKFITAIDNSHPSITSNQTTIKIYKTVVPQLGVERNYSMKFYNRLKATDYSIYTTKFNVIDIDNQVIITNKGNRLLMGYYKDNGRFVTVRDVGTVDYIKGILSFNKLNVIDFEGSEAKLFAIPDSVDLKQKELNILRIKDSDISIKLVKDSTY